MMELTINGTVYQFKFGMGFLREANKLTVVPVQGMPGTTKDFLSKANATKKAVKEILKEYEEQMAKKKAQEL